MSHIELEKRSIGINFTADGPASIAVWAPLANSVAVQLREKKESIALQKDELGYWRGTSSVIQPGTLYAIRIDNEKELPDPASLSQPEGVHGPSAAMDLGDFNWTDAGWTNTPLDEYIIYELHTGTFSSAGTFKGIEEKLDYLKELGITAIEIMPVAQFPGTRNWGYDGVFPFAVQHSYGGAKGLQQLVDACHQKGLAVILDVVYNHLGPEGNYLGQYGPYFTDKYKTPWGNAVNFDDAWCDGVREYFIENALMWFRDFHIDALRLDAVHAIKDFSPVPILQAIRQRVDRLMQATGRKHYLIVELDLNDTRFINSMDEGGYGMDAQWVDEFHHALRRTAGGEPTGYYSDFNGIQHLAKAYADAYVYDGQFSPHRKKKFGIKAEKNAGQQFIVFSQNHDQVGNRMLGERTSQLASFELQKLLAGAVLVSPFLPMLFMGEEWSESNPFLYFVSHTDPELAAAVRKGRKEEFAAFHAAGEAPDPMAETTFEQSRLQWHLVQQGHHQVLLQYYKALIALRKQHPALRHLDRKKVAVRHNEAEQTLVLHRWHGTQHILCLMNFSKDPQVVTLPNSNQQWTKLLDSAANQWGGPGAAPHATANVKMVQLQAESILILTNG